MLIALMMLALQGRPEPLVERLGADDFAEREKADQELRALGPRALPALRGAAENDDPEIAARAKRIIDDIQKATRDRRQTVTVRMITPEIDLSVSPAGVRLVEKATGETFEAPSMQAFRATHAETAERYLKDLTFEFTVPESGEEMPPEFREFFGPHRERWGDEFGGRTGRIGAHVGPVSETMREQLGLAEGEGVMVERVDAGSLAEQFGLLPHDVIVAVDGETVGNTWTLRAKIAACVKERRGFDVTVLRKAKRETLKMSFEKDEE